MATNTQPLEYLRSTVLPQLHFLTRTLRSRLERLTITDSYYENTAGHQTSLAIGDAVRSKYIRCHTFEWSLAQRRVYRTQPVFPLPPKRKRSRRIYSKHPMRLRSKTKAILEEEARLLDNSLTDMVTVATR